MATRFSCIFIAFLQDAYTAEYRFDGSIKPKENENQLIDPNHSLFILVDDKKVNTFGGELDWRIKFEKFLIKYNAVAVRTQNKELKEKNEQGKEENGTGIPVISVLLNGGVSAIEACARRLANKHTQKSWSSGNLKEEDIGFEAPLIVVKGSGRAADLIAELYGEQKRE